MIRYITLILLLVLVAGLLNGCADLGFPDLETQMRRREKAKVDVDIKALKFDIKRANRDATVSAKKLLSKETDNDIAFRTELKAIYHEMDLAEARRLSELHELARESGIFLYTGDADIKQTNYKAADSLLKNLKKKRVKLSKDAPILVASFVDLDDLSESSAFGRVISEKIASRFNQKGYATIEVKLRTNIFIKELSGEFLLSRELAEIGTKHRAQAVVVGTYSVGSKRIYLTARVINVSDGRVLGSHDYKARIDLDTLKMLLKGKDRGKPGWL